MKISIIIINYNTYEYTKNCINSVIEALDYTPTVEGEIILIDNNSPDGSGIKLQEDFQNDDRIKIVLNDKNLGFSKANNIGLEIATGDYLLLLNSDTVLSRNVLKDSLNFMENHPEYDVLGCKVVLPDGKLDAACKRSFPTPLNSLYHTLKLDKIFSNNRHFGSYNLTYVNPDTTMEVDCIMGAFMLLRREVYEDVGGLDSDYFMYGEDIDWCYRIKEAGYRIVYHPEGEITHYKKKSWNGKRNPEVLDAFYDSMLIFYDKHYQDLYPKPVSILVKLGTKTIKQVARIANNIKNE